MPSPRTFGTDITTSPRGANSKATFSARNGMPSKNTQRRAANSKPDCLALADAITCANDAARAAFRTGLSYLYNYNHEAAVEAFQEAAAADPGCAMAWWGVAYAVSSNYNFPPGLASGHDAIQAAVRIMDGGRVALSPLERDLIAALATRSSAEAAAAADPAALSMGNTPELNAAFAAAMAGVYAKHAHAVEGGLDVAAVYVESLMNLRPWALWERDAATGMIVPADENTLRIVEVLEENGMGADHQQQHQQKQKQQYERHPGLTHPALCHLYCHAMELSPTPEKALGAADTLRTLMPDCGHLVHMPSHIDAWVGQWQKGLEANVKGVASDDAFVAAHPGKESCLYKFYRLHNHHFVVWCAMHTGQYRVAMEYARRVDAALPAGDSGSGVSFLLGGQIPMGAVFLEAYKPLKWHAMVRFGRWEEILQEPVEADGALFPTTVATARYARALALAATATPADPGRLAAAEAEEARFLAALANPALAGRVLHNNPVWVADEDQPSVLGVSKAMLRGEIEYRRAALAKAAARGGGCGGGGGGGGGAATAATAAAFDAAFALLRGAVDRSLNLKYDEPWGQMQPVRHALGALLLEQGRVGEAEEVFRADLALWRDNMWGLLGLRTCLERRSAAFGPPGPAGAARDTAACLNVEAERRAVARAFREAARWADEVPERTCFCAGAGAAGSCRAKTETAAAAQESGGGCGCGNKSKSE